MNWITTILVHSGLVIGIIGYLLSEFMSILPAVTIQYRIPLRVISLIIFSVSIWFEGGLYKEAKYKSQILEMQSKISELEVKSNQINTQIEKVYVTKLQKVKVVQTVVKTKIKKIASVIDKECSINPAVIDILNTSAKGQ